MILVYAFCLISSLPFFYYIFVLDVNFFMVKTPGATYGENISLSFNFSDKILIISSIILFHMIPFLINKKFFYELINKFRQNLLIIPAILSIFICLLFFFDYQLNYTGGGIFFQISNIFFKNNILFYFISFLSLILLFSFSRNNFDNFLVFLILIISNIQNTIYHKYYDPLIMILFFSIITIPESLKFFDKRKNILFIYSFYSFYILARIVKNSFLN